MPRTKSPERTNAQRHRVLATAAELFVKNGYHATTMEDIAKSLNMTKPAIYYYFPSKIAILYQLHDWTIGLFTDRAAAILKTEDPPDVKLRKMIISHIDTAVAEMSGVSALLHEEFALTGKARAKIVRKRDMYDRMFRRVIQDGIDQGIFVDCDAALASFYILGFVNYVPHWYKPDGRLSKEAISESFADMALGGLLGNRLEALATTPLTTPHAARGLVEA